MTYTIRHPITPTTVTVNGDTYGPRCTIWAGLRWQAAVLRSLLTNDPHLSVPFCHIDNDVPNDDCGWYRVRPRDERFRFVRARNGAWVLERSA